MKPLLILILSLSLSFTAFAQADSGFTDKAEATNQTVNGLKEGKWLQYYRESGGVEVETKSKNAPFYRLTIYKAGKPVGIERQYYKSGKLEGQGYWSNGKQNGIAKGYYEDGKLAFETPFIDGERNGMLKIYYENGKLKSETAYLNDQVVSTKSYDEYGNEIQ